MSLRPPDARRSSSPRASGDLPPDFRQILSCVPVVKGTFTEFTGVGFGFINRIAVDSADGIFCTTTEDDASVDKGICQETLNAFSFSNTFNVVPMHIALHPSLRSGYVDGPDAGVTEIQSFTSREEPAS